MCIRDSWRSERTNGSILAMVARNAYIWTAPLSYNLRAHNIERTSTTRHWLVIKTAIKTRSTMSCAPKSLAILPCLAAVICRVQSVSESTISDMGTGTVLYYRPFIVFCSSQLNFYYFPPGLYPSRVLTPQLLRNFSMLPSHVKKYSQCHLRVPTLCMRFSHAYLFVSNLTMQKHTGTPPR